MTASTSNPDDGPVTVEELEGGQVWRVRLATPKANILDIEKTELLSALFGRASEERGLKAVLIEGEGPHFSFGANVQEHLPGQFERMLRGFHGLFYRMLDAEVMTLAAVRGQCLGGALELVSFCHRVFAAPDAKLLRIGLVDELADDPGDAALAYARTHLLPRSASSLRLAVRAVRQGFADRFRAELAEVERLYMNELMSTADAQEGLQAFTEKRKPEWRNA